DLARVARDEAGLLERRAQLRIRRHQRARDPVADGHRLCGDAAALHADVHPVLVLGGRDLEGLMHDHARRLAAEIVRERPRVDHPLAATRLETNTGARGLALPRRPDHLTLSSHTLFTCSPAAAPASAPGAGARGPRTP